MKGSIKQIKNEGFSLIELIVVIAILIIIIVFGLPFFLRLVNMARFASSKSTLNENYIGCINNPSRSINNPFIPGVTFNSSNCSGLMSANIDNKCTISMNMATGEKVGWSNSYDSCAASSNFASNKNDNSQNSQKKNANTFDGNRSLSGKFTGLETTERGFYFMDITPDKLETGEKMALLTPGGEHDLELFIVGTNEKLSPGTIDKNQEYTDQLNKGNFKICMSGGSSSWVNGRQSPTVCSGILPTEVSNSIGISYSNGSYDVNYSGGSISGAGGFAPGPGNSNQTVVGKFDQSTKEKIQNQYNKGYGLGSANDNFSNFKGSINTLRHVDKTNMDMGKPPWNNSEVSKTGGNLYDFFVDGGKSTPGDTYSGEDWENQKGF